MSRRRAARRRAIPAFSLIEVLLAIGLMLALMGALYGFFLNVLNTRARALDMTHRDRAATVLLERIEADLFSAMAGVAPDQPGIEGNATSLRILTCTVPVEAAGEPGEPARSVLADLAFAEYRFQADRQVVELLRSSPMPAGQPGDEAARGGVPQPLETRFEQVRFRFYDGQAWREAFNSIEAGQLPVAVEVALWFTERGPAERSEEWRLPEAVDRSESAASPAALRREAFEVTGSAEPLRPPDRARIMPVPDAGPDDAEEPAAE
jgi:hypothetical protein